MFFTPTNWMNVWTGSFTPVGYTNLKILIIRIKSQIPVKEKTLIGDPEHLNYNQSYLEKKLVYQRIFHSSNILTPSRFLLDKNRCTDLTPGSFHPPTNSAIFCNFKYS